MSFLKSAKKLIKRATSILLLASRKNEIRIVSVLEINIKTVLKWRKDWLKLEIYKQINV